MTRAAAVTDPLARRLASAPWRVVVRVRGAVQGVGFRPFVYRLAHELELAGWVVNDTRGVVIEVEGPAANLDTFLARVRLHAPSCSVIDTLSVSWLDSAGYVGFEIRRSANQGDRSVAVLPELATCEACLLEISNPRDRRYRYPFTNCTVCGPRFTIVQALPYDRPDTTMRGFSLCPSCRREYEDPRDRRFHAQPNACPKCGPRLASLRHEVGPVDRGADLWRRVAGEDAALRETVDALRRGEIVAVKGLGGFHLMVDAGNDAAIVRLRERKRRPAKPFAIMVRDLDEARTLCEVSPEAESALAAIEAPIVLLPRLPGPAAVAAATAPDVPTLGVMLPANPLHHLLVRDFGGPLVATSGNLSDEPICIDELEALERLDDIADSFLVHDRPIARHVDDSVAQIVAGAPRLLRRARGYAPLPIQVPRPLPVILALGGQLKNTVALSIGRQVFISQHIGDLGTPQAEVAFEQVVADFLRLYQVKPVVVAHDLHPDYRSTTWAQAPRDQGIAGLLASSKRAPVQHHHAHMAACLAENGVDEAALGVIWDGTGYGLDGSVWGGEFLLGDACAATRVAHLRPFALPGGEAAVTEPCRTALALLWDLYGDAALQRDDLAPLRHFGATERAVLAQMLRRGVRSPRTTSMGRLFDGVAALIGLHPRVSFEGQAAMALQFAADPSVVDAYPLPLADITGSPMLVDWRPLLEAIIEDLRVGRAVGIIAARFHNALVEALLQVAEVVGSPRVALSGGCFQNRLLTDRAVQRLRACGFEVLLHTRIPTNDGGLSLGQIAVAAARLD
jgi:hydrogenase maturation protein HypF